MPMAHQPGVRSVALTALRRRRGLRSQDLAGMYGCDEGYVSRLETREEPSWEVLVELAVRVMKYDLEEVESTVHGLTRGTESMHIEVFAAAAVRTEALERLASALEIAPREARGRILVKKASTLNQMADPSAAIAVLQEAAPYLENQRASRLWWMWNFLFIENLCHLCRFREARD